MSPYTPTAGPEDTHFACSQQPGPPTGMNHAAAFVMQVLQASIAHAHLLLCGPHYRRPQPCCLLGLFLVVAASIHLAALTLAGFTATGGGRALGRQPKERLHTHMDTMQVMVWSPGQDSRMKGAVRAASWLGSIHKNCFNRITCCTSFGRTLHEQCYAVLCSSSSSSAPQGIP